MCPQPSDLHRLFRSPNRRHAPFDQFEKMLLLKLSHLTCYVLHLLFLEQQRPFWGHPTARDVRMFFLPSLIPEPFHDAHGETFTSSWDRLEEMSDRKNTEFRLPLMGRGIAQDCSRGSTPNH
jgi:hypothetical protein